MGNASTKPGRKLLLIGLDGATFDLIKPWAEEGRLPTIRKLMENGVHGNLRSTIPPVTIPAWPVMFTGKNPGKIGIFSLLKHEGKKFRTVNAGDCDGKRLWSYLSDSGIRNAIINVPVTFPPDRLNGIMISGLGASTELDYTYPAGLKEEIDGIVNNYEIDFYGFHRSRIKKFLEMLYERTEKRKKVVIELLRRKEWDFAFVVFTGSDRIQHYLWDTYEKEHPLYENDKHKDSIPKYWEYLDGAVGEIIDNHGKDANILIVSDHGFQGMTGRFNVNDWLIKEGYLVVKNNGHGKKRGVLNRIGITRERVKWLMWRLNLQKIRRRLPEFISRKVESLLKNSENETGLDDIKIDWKRTTAYSFDYTGGICVNKNLPENKRNAIKKEITEKMKNIDNPLTGKKLVVEFFEPSEVYSGPYVKDAPDIIFFVENLRYTTQVSIGHGGAITPLDRSKPSNATHTMNGIFIACGPDIAKGREIKGAQITDITPTILHMFGLPVPEDMDGRALKEIFRPGSEPAEQKVSYTEPDREKRERHMQKKEDEEKIKQRLKDLGYI